MSMKTLHNKRYSDSRSFQGSAKFSFQGFATFSFQGFATFSFQGSATFSFQGSALERTVLDAPHREHFEPCSQLSANCKRYFAGQQVTSPSTLS